MKAGAYDFLPKPFTPDELRLIVNRGLERRHLIHESNRLREEKEKIQRQFITFVSHQLQSPLSAIQQYLDVLKHLGDTPNKEQLQQEWIDRSLKKTKELIAIIRDWLTISKIEAGSLVNKISPVNIRPLLNDIIQNYEVNAKQKNIQISLNTPDIISNVKGCGECLAVLISNLVENSIKYNKQNGHVTISVNEEEQFVNFNISDAGIGIPEKNLELIFKEFNRVINKQTQGISGTGLGLPICKKIITELGGSINVESRLNEGSTFHVKLPKFVD